MRCFFRCNLVAFSVLSAFVASAELKSVSFDIRLPMSWDIDYCDASGKWQKFPIYLTDSYSVLENQYNAVHPSGGAISATAIRVNIVPEKKYAVGVLQTKFTTAK